MPRLSQERRVVIEEQIRKLCEKLKADQLNLPVSENKTLQKLIADAKLNKDESYGEMQFFRDLLKQIQTEKRKEEALLAGNASLVRAGKATLAERLHVAKSEEAKAAISKKLDEATIGRFASVMGGRDDRSSVRDFGRLVAQDAELGRIMQEAIKEEEEETKSTKGVFAAMASAVRSVRSGAYQGMVNKLANLEETSHQDIGFIKGKTGTFLGDVRHDIMLARGKIRAEQAKARATGVLGKENAEEVERAANVVRALDVAFGKASGEKQDNKWFLRVCFEAFKASMLAPKERSGSSAEYTVGEISGVKDTGYTVQGFTMSTVVTKSELDERYKGGLIPIKKQPGLTGEQVRNKGMMALLGEQAAKKKSASSSAEDEEVLRHAPKPVVHVHDMAKKMPPPLPKALLDKKAAKEKVESGDGRKSSPKPHGKKKPGDDFV